MQVVHSQSMVAYNVAFLKPSFQLARNLPDILAVFYDSLSSRFSIPPGDMEAFGGTALSDVRVRIRLFSNLGTLELFVDRFSANFQSLRNEKDFDVVGDSIELGDAALRSALPDIRYKSASFRLASWWSVVDGEEATNKFIMRTVNSDVLKQPFGLGLELALATTRWRFRNNAELWSVDFMMEPSLVPDSHLFLDCNVTFDAGSLYESLQQRLQHCRTVVENLLKYLGLETTQVNQNP